MGKIMKQIIENDSIKGHLSKINTLESISDYYSIYVDLKEKCKDPIDLNRLATKHYIHSMSLDFIEREEICYVYDSSYQVIKRKRIK